MKPIKGQKNVKPLFKVVAWLYPLWKNSFPTGCVHVERCRPCDDQCNFVWLFEKDSGELDIAVCARSGSTSVAKKIEKYS